MTMFAPLINRGVAKNGILVTNSSFEIINFVGDNITVEPGSEDVVNVSVASSDVNIFGGVFFSANSENLSSTTSESYIDKVTISGSLIEGLYRVGWYYEWQFTDNRQPFKAILKLNNTETLMEHMEAPYKTDSDIFYNVSGFDYFSGSGSFTVSLKYCSGAKGKSASIRRARLEIWRVE